MNALDELEEIKELVNDDKRFKYKGIVNFNCDNIKEELNYASKCHSLEEQLGCPLEVLFNAVQNGIYYEDVADCMKLNFVELHTNLDYEYVLRCDDTDESFLTSNYKKTWWLKEDRSE